MEEKNMNLGQFKDHVCYLCLVGCVVTSWSLTQQELLGSNNSFGTTFIFKKLTPFIGGS